MKLLIISNMAHYRRDGVIVGHGATAREISYLATLFEEVRHVGCFQPGEAPASALPYTQPNIHLIPLPFSGGVSLLAKLKVLYLSPLYIYTILRELPKADVVHVRCPANISMIAIILLALVRKPKVRWVKYACNWKPGYRDAWTSVFQRWWLEHNLHRGWVTVNGVWPHQPDHVRTFMNPCITDDELVSAESRASQKNLSAPLRLLFVGIMHPKKGAGRALQVARRLREDGIPFTFNLVGDGPGRADFETQAAELGLADFAQFHGELPRFALNEFYAQSHIMLYPTDSSEGWPKVLSESMAYGVVPISGNVSSIPYYLQKFGVGKALDPASLDEFADAIRGYIQNPSRWKEESQKAVETAPVFSYGNYLDAVRKLLKF